MATVLLTPQDLANRWSLHLDTLKQWRWNGKGPPFIKIGRQTLYRLQDIEEFEEQKRRKSTSSLSCQGV